LSRRSTIVFAVLTTVALGAIALFALPWVRRSSGSVTADFIVIIGWATVVLAAAWFQVAAFIPGANADDPVDMDRPLTVRSGFGRPILIRSALLVIAVLCNLFWTNVVAGDFWFGHYSRIGVYATSLRSASAKTRKWAISKIAEMAHEPIRDLVGPLSKLADDPGDEVHAHAVAALGHMAGRMRLSVRKIEADGDGSERWEYDLLRNVYDVLGDPAARVREERGPSRAAWIYTVGRMGDESALPILADVIVDEASPVDIRTAAVVAVGDVMSPDSLPVLGHALEDGEGDVVVFAAWALGRLMHGMVANDVEGAGRDARFKAARETLSRVLPRLDAQPACAYLGFFPGIGDAGMTTALIELSKSPVFLVRCTRVERLAWFGAPEPIVKKGLVADHVLGSWASVALGNHELRRYLDVASKDEGYPAEIRSGMQTILKGMQSGSGDGR